MDQMLHTQRSKTEAVTLIYDKINTQFNNMKNEQTLLVSGFAKFDSSHGRNYETVTFKEMFLFKSEDIRMLK